MNGLTLATVPDWVWGVICLVLAAITSVWLYAYLRRQRKQKLVGATPAPRTPESSPEGDDTLDFTFISAEYERRRYQAEESERRIESRLSVLRAKSPETAPAEEIMRSASPQERESLASILKLPPTQPVHELVRSVRRAGNNEAAAQMRKLKGLEPYVSYREVLRDAASKMGAPSGAAKGTDAQLEKALIVAALKKMMDKAAPEQQAELMQALGKQQQQMTRGLGMAAGTLVLANLSGFGLYVAASSALGGVTGALGITLPFAAYTGMSSVISAVVGPIGWIALIFGGAAIVAGVNYKKTVPAVLCIASVRARLIAERDHERKELLAEKAGGLADAQANVAALRAILDRMAAEGTETISRSEVPI